MIKIKKSVFLNKKPFDEQPEANAVIVSIETVWRMFIGNKSFDFWKTKKELIYQEQSFDLSEIINA